MNGSKTGSEAGSEMDVRQEGNAATRCCLDTIGRLCTSSRKLVQ